VLFITCELFDSAITLFQFVNNWQIISIKWNYFLNVLILIFRRLKCNLNVDYLRIEKVIVHVE